MFCSVLVILFAMILYWLVAALNLPFSTLEFFPSQPETSPTANLMKAVCYNSRPTNDATADHQQQHKKLYLSTTTPRPLLQPHQILIQTVAASINPVDFKFLRNLARIPRLLLPTPKIPGADVSGTIVQIGSKVQQQQQEQKWQVGDAVVAMLPLLLTRWGSLAEYVAVDSSLIARVVEINDNDSDSTHLQLMEAASFPLVALTVIQAFGHVLPHDDDKEDNMNHQTKLLLKGKRVLIQAGAGGVGTFAIQYAKHVLQAQEVATTASSSKADLLRSLGADHVIDYHSTKFENVIQDYDIVLDPMSWAYEKRTLNSGVLKPTGHYISIASSDWKMWDGREQTNNPTQAFRFLKHSLVNLVWPGRLPKYHIAIVQPDGKQLKTAMDLVGKRILRPVIDRVFTFEEANMAFDYLEQGHATGKVLVVPSAKGYEV